MGEQEYPNGKAASHGVHSVGTETQLLVSHGLDSTVKWAVGIVVSVWLAAIGGLFVTQQLALAGHSETVKTKVSAMESEQDVVDGAQDKVLESVSERLEEQAVVLRDLTGAVGQITGRLEAMSDNSQ